MLKRLKRLIAGTISAVMCTSSVMSNVALSHAGREAQTAAEKAGPISSDYDIKSSNSLGNFFKHAAAEEDVQNPLADNICNSQFQITSLEFDVETGTVRVASTQQTEAKLIVSFINDETSENVLSVETAVSAGELVNSELKADTSKLPHYYLVKAQLFDTLNRPVGKPYTLSRYTKEFQEILATDINDFDQEQVVNLDEDETTNFLVLNEDTVIAESSEEQNTLVSADYDNNVFVFDNADESVASLEKGEYLYIQPDDDNIIAVSVEKIEKDGDTVTVSGNDDIEDMFDFIKIESDANMGKAQIDTSGADEGVSFPNVDENGDVVVNDDGSFDFEYVAPQHDLKFDYCASKTFSLDSIFDPQTEDTTPHDPYEDFNVKNADKISGTVTISVNFNFFKKFGTTKIELTVKVTPTFTVTRGFSGSGYSEPTSSSVQSLGATIAKIVIPTSIPGTLIQISPRVFVEFSGKITFTVKWDNIRGFKYEDGEVTPISSILDEKTFSVSLKITGEIYAGLELKLYLEVANENIAALGFDIKAGLRIRAEADLGAMFEQYMKNMDDPPDKVIINDSETKSYYHACKFCIQAKTDFVIKVNLDVCVLRKKKSWNLFDLSINLPFFNAYFSSETGFGWGDCYYNRFRTTFNVISSSDGGYIPGAVVKLDDKERTIGGSGNAVFYCLPGTYSYTVKYGDTTLESGYVNVDNRHVEKTIEADITLDPEGNPDGGYKPGRSRTATGAVVTQPVTTQPAFVPQTLPAPSFTKDEIIAETGELGEHISYMLYPDGYLYACGYGDMYDFGSSPFRDPSIIKYAVIENAGDEKNGGVITSIGSNVFINCSNMESINLPQTIKRIGKSAFRNCSSFSTVSYDVYDYVKEKVVEVKYPEGQLVMPEAVTSVDEYAFANCASITDIIIPATISELSSYVFSGTGISEMNVPDTITKIKDYVFSDCTSLKKVVISEGTESIGYHIFSGCSAIEDITIPYIGHSLAEANEEGSSQQFSDFFLNGNDTDFFNVTNSGGWRRYIPKSLKSITVTSGTRVPDYAFYRISSVKNITVPGTMKSFGAYSYADCISLENIYIPEGVASIEKYAFSNCSSSALKTVKFPTTLTSVGNYAFTECKGLTNVTVPKTVKTIGEYTFNNCSALKTVVIYGGADGIGNHIFSGCKSLADLTLPFAGLNEKSIDDPKTVSELSVLFLNGDDTDYYNIINSGGWRRYIPKSLKKVTVLSGTRLSDYAFYRFTGVETFVLPKSMTEIGNYSFAGCSSITKDYISEGIKYIDDHAFEGCTSISDGKIPEGVISIGKYAFSNCSSASLKTITFPKTLTTVGDYAFSGCSGLTSITVPQTVKNLGSYAFSDCSSVKTAVINGGADGIGYHVFSGCKSLAELTLPFAGFSLEAVNTDGSSQEIVNLFLNGNDKEYYNITNTGGWRRYIPKALKKITITGGTRIPNYSFYRLNGVETITIPDSITEIGSYAYAECSSMKTAYMPEGIEKIGSYSFRNCSCTDFDTVKFPTTLEVIGNNAFSGCTGLTKITVPDTVKNIGDYAFSDCSALETAVIEGGADGIGSHIFSGCKSFAELTVPFAGFSADSTAKAIELSTYFLNGNDEDYYNITNSGGWRRYIPKSLKKITILSGTRIPDYTFYRLGGVESIVLPDTITEIGSYAYAECASITDTCLPEGVLSIGNYAFSSCTNEAFDDISFPTTLTTIGAYAFSGCTGLKKITVPETVKTIGEYTFNNCSALKTVVIYGGADGIGNHIFSGCKSLADLTLPFAAYSKAAADDPKSVNELSGLFLNGNDEDYYNIINSGGWRRYIPKSLKKVTVLSGTRLSDYAFYRFAGVETFVLPKSMTEIGNYSFAGCSSITKDYISEGIKYIDDHAFDGCTSISDGKIPEGVISLGKYAFSNCSSASLKTVTFPKTLTTIGNNAFSGCSGLTNVTVPETVKTIGEYAFSDCSSLASAVIMGGADGIGNHVFSGCKSLAELTLPFAGFSLEAVNTDGSSQELVNLFLNGNDDEFYNIINTGGWRRYIPKSLKKVTILGGDRIPNYAFYRMNGVEEIVVPDDITSLGSYSFWNCTSLKNAVMPNSLLYIGDHAFANCSSSDFSTISFPESIETIGEYAFSNCDSLISVTVPESVKTISNYAFEECDSLKTAEITGENTTIGSHIFSACKSLESLTLPFAGSSLSAVNADGSAQQISELFLNGNDDEFYNITNTGGWRRYIPKSLKTIIINGGKKIPKYAFYRMLGVEDVYLPKGVTSIADNSFDGCSGIQNVFYPSTKSDWEKKVTVGANNEEIDGKVRFLNDDGVYDTTTTTSGTVTTTSTTTSTTSKTTTSTTSKATSTTSKTTTSTTSTTTSTTSKTTTSITSTTTSTTSKTTTSTTATTTSTTSKTTTSTTSTTTSTTSKTTTSTTSTTTSTTSKTTTSTTSKATSTTSKTTTSTTSKTTSTTSKTTTSTTSKTTSTTSKTTTSTTSTTTSTTSKTTTSTTSTTPSTTSTTSTTTATTTETTSTSSETTTETTTSTTSETTETTTEITSSTTSETSETTTTTTSTSTSTTTTTSTTSTLTTSTSTSTTTETTTAPSTTASTPVDDEPDIELGDASGDGKVDAVDASIILMIYAMNSTSHNVPLTEKQKAAYDVNGDGKIDALDASYILCYYVYVSISKGDVISLKEFIFGV